MSGTRYLRCLAAAAIVLCAGSQSAAATTGGIRNQPTVAGSRAKLSHGLAIPPADAPPAVSRAIRAANRIVKGKPYCYGGGHARWRSRCYDCSGSISYALGRPGAGLLSRPMVSGDLARWGAAGKGRWVTVYANRGHVYAVIAGLRLDTSMTRGAGPGWSATQRSSAGYRVRHPRGL